MGGVLYASLRWCEELDQGELHDLKAPPCHHYLVGVYDQDCLLVDATFECEPTDLLVVSTIRHFLALATQFEQEWIPFSFPAPPRIFQNPRKEFLR